MSRQKPHVTAAHISEYLAKHRLWTPLVQKAYKIAGLVHRNAKRDDGVSYLEQHIYPIVRDTVEYFRESKLLTEQLVSLAFIHDVLEDTNTYSHEILFKTFGETVATAAQFLKKPRVFQKGKYRTQKVKHYEHKLFVDQLEMAPFEVKVLKCIDRINNLKCTDAERRPKQYERFLKDTNTYYIPFALKIDQNLFEIMRSEADALKENLKVTYNSKDNLNMSV